MPEERNSVEPKVLIATTRRWIPTARLAMALARTGFSVDAVCPPGHPIAKTNCAKRLHTYRGLAPLQSFSAAIASQQPDLIIPGDDLAAWHFHDLYDREKQSGEAGATICNLIERSLGDVASFPVVYSRSKFLEIARRAGVRVPKTQAITSLSELEGWLNKNGFPAVLKANGTSGGDGVRIVRNSEAAKHAFRALNAPPLLLRAMKRALIDQDYTFVKPSLFRSRLIVNAQSYISGREATSALACWKGNVLAALHFEVLNKSDSSGPATVLRLIEDAEMSETAEKIVRTLKLSGLHGLDYMLEVESGDAYLIEINPRSTQVGHLTLGHGRDLPAALYSAVTGKTLQESPAVTEKDTIALFPQEWLRDSESTFLKSCYHDVPWEEPKLVNACIRNPGKWRGQNSQQERIQAFWSLAGPAYENSGNKPGREADR
jgi:Carbamoyl-phosphate synthase L chain, ATP binding domain